MYLNWVRACVLSPFSQFDSWRPYGPWSTRLLCPWDSPGENTGVGCCAVLQGIFWTQRWNPPLLSPSLAGRFFTTSAAWRAPCLNCMCIKTHEMCNIKSEWRTSLVVQWLRIHQSMQRMQVWSLVQEGSTKPLCHKSWAHTPRAQALKQEKPPQWEACVLLQSRVALLAASGESLCASGKTQCSQNQ